MTKITINGIARDMTAEEQAEYDTRVAERAATKPQRQLEEIKELRLERLQATDYMANVDYTMPDYIKTWRQSLRDIPANFDSSKYDELLDRETDEKKETYRQLTHSIWKQPTS